MHFGSCVNLFLVHGLPLVSLGCLGDILDIFNNMLLIYESITHYTSSYRMICYTYPCVHYTASSLDALHRCLQGGVTPCKDACSPLVSAVFDDGACASRSVVGDATMVFLPPEPYAIQGKQAGAIAEYIYIYIYIYTSGSQCIFMHICMNICTSDLKKLRNQDSRDNC